MNANILLLILTGFAALCVLKILSNWRKKRSILAKSEYGRVMEDRAGDDLRKLGYEPIEQHPVIEYVWFVDGQERPVRVTPDWRVRQGNRTYLVEVKTGNQANPNQAKIRRQLLEYALYSEDDGVIFFDATRQTAHRVEFSVPIEGKAWPWASTIIILSLIGLVFWIFRWIPY